MTAVLAALAMLMGGAVWTVLLARTPRPSLLIALLSIAGACVLCLSAAIPVLIQGRDPLPTTSAWPMPLGHARLTLDGLSAWFLLSTAIVGLSVAVYSWGYFKADLGREPVAALGALLCVLVAALILVVTAADAVLFLLGWESLMLSAFFLVSFHQCRAEVRRAAWIYLTANHLGTALFVLPLFAILAAIAGTLDFHSFRAALQDGNRGTSALLFLLGLFGFGTKAGFMPMHVWLPVAHPAAPSPVSALLSGVVIKAGIYALLRLLGWLPTLPVGCAILMLVFGMVSGVLGVLYALAQHDIKRLLAYHSVENIGIIGLGVGMGMLGQTLNQPALVALGYGGALLHVLNHALFKGLLFLSAGAVIHATGTGDIERLGGLARRTPVNSAFFLLAAVSICGLPPFNGFVSEWILFRSLFGGAWGATPLSAGISALGALSLALMGGLALACFAKVFGVVFLGEPRDPLIQVHPTPFAMRAGMFIPAALCVGIGVWPGLFVPLVAGGVLTVAGSTGGDFNAALQTVIAPTRPLTWMAALLLAFVASLALVRRALLRRNQPQPDSRNLTWGCGYVQPSSRMQYTASSFAWSLVQGFRGALWPHRRVVAPIGPFSGHSELESHAPDIAEHDLFAPLLRGVSRAARMIRTVSWSGRPATDATPVEAAGRIGPLRVLLVGAVNALRRGRIHVCMAFIVLTLLVVFVVESLAESGAPAPSATGVGVLDGDSK